MKKLGAIDFIPRKEKITSAQKSLISRTYTQVEKEFKHALKKPEDFAIHKVSKANAEILEKSGYKLIKGRAVIPLADGKDKKYVSATVAKGVITYKRPGKTNQVFLSGDSEALMKKAAFLQSQKGRNQVVSFSLRGFSVSSQDYPSFEAMVNYLQNVILPKIVLNERKQTRRKKESFSKKRVEQEFWSSVSIVTIGDKIATR